MAPLVEIFDILKLTTKEAMMDPISKQKCYSNVQTREGQMHMIFESTPDDNVFKIIELGKNGEADIRKIFSSLNPEPQTSKRPACHSGDDVSQNSIDQRLNSDLALPSKLMM
ncbi:hypothetical protein Pst134EB_006489 [Puccinia striiformis f. sp. tritici]|nr:hypothetical protein Pst134EB_006489 [Puccinia striiformis f. sp. tritici]